LLSGRGAETYNTIIQIEKENDVDTTVTPFNKKKLVKVDKTSLSLRIPIELYDHIRIETAENKQTVCSLLEELIEMNTSPEDVQLSLADLMAETAASETLDQDAEMKIVTVAVSMRHYCLVRLEALRQHTKVRTLVSHWLQERYYEPEDSEYQMIEEAA